MISKDVMVGLAAKNRANSVASFASKLQWSGSTNLL